MAAIEQELRDEVVELRQLIRDTVAADRAVIYLRRRAEAEASVAKLTRESDFDQLQVVIDLNRHVLDAEERLVQQWRLLYAVAEESDPAEVGAGDGTD